MNRHSKMWGMWAMACALLICGSCGPSKPADEKPAPSADGVKKTPPKVSDDDLPFDTPPKSTSKPARPPVDMPDEAAPLPPEPPSEPALEKPAEKPKPAAPKDLDPSLPFDPPSKPPGTATAPDPAPAPAPAEPAAPAKPADTEKPAASEKPAEKPAAPEKPVPENAAAPEKAEPEKTSAKVLLGSPELTAGIPGSGPLKLEDIEKWLADPKNHEPLQFDLPLGLSAGLQQVKGLEANPLTRAKIELGRQLYFDPRLSADQSVSCASCHHPDTGWAAHTQFGVGIKKQTGGRNSPVSFNRILSDLQFWDGRAGSLEQQAIGPIANPIEMGNTHEACVECLKAIPGYKVQFEKIFGEMNIEAVGAALASFERAIVTGPSPFDYYDRFRPMEKMDADDLKSDDPDLYAKYVEFKKAADDHPMSGSAERGRALFFSEKANCTACHVGANFTDEKYHNLGVGMEKENPDLGREAITHDPKDRGAFKTPTIRNVAMSAPYMHDGSQKTLEEVVDWYAKGGHPNEFLDAKIKKLESSDQDKKDLVEFMKACTGDFPKMATNRLPE